MASKKKLSLPKLGILVRNTDFFTSGDYEFDIIAEFRRCAHFWKYEVLLDFVSQKDMEETTYSDFIQAHDLMGTFLLGFAPDDIWVTQLTAAQTPTVLLECEVPQNPYVCTIGSDHIEGMDSAVSYLISMGHSKIAFFNEKNTPIPSVAGKYRKEGYLQSLKKYGIPVSRQLYQELSTASEEIKPAVTKMVKAGTTAIICGSDKLAAAVLSECRAQGKQIPADITIIGYQGLSLCEKTFPTLSSITEPRAALGYFAFSSLRNLFMGMPLGQVRLHTELILRGSTV